MSENSMIKTKETKKWYSSSFRRHLCDMHINDDNELYLSEFSPRTYFENLKKANVKSAMLYFQSHAGHCFYPTKSGVMHKSFAGREDLMKELVRLCHNGEIDVIGYYSLNYNLWAHDRFPEWRMVRKDGISRHMKEKKYRYGLCCPNNGGYRDFVFEQIKEMSEYFEVEGMFYDMPFWPHYCYCESCRRRWSDEVGGEIPTEETDNKWSIFEEKRREWMGEFANAVTSETKRLMPGVSVEQNYAFAVLPGIDKGMSERINDACDYVGGDLYNGYLNQSFACKYYYSVTRNQPFELMTGRCDPNLSVHTITKSKADLTRSVMLAYAHHGANLVIDAIDPVGTMDERVYDLIGDIYRQEEKYEKYLEGDMVAEVGVFYNLESKLNLQGQEHNNYTGTLNSVRTLIENHIPVCTVSDYNVEECDKYKFIILSNPNFMKESSVDRLIEYVKQGGTLYFSNVDQSRLFETLTGGTFKEYTKESKVYIAPIKEYEGSFDGFNAKYPIPVNYRVPVTEGFAPEDVIATITLPYTVPGEREFASIHSNPPGIPTDIPAIVLRKFGKGNVIWSCAPIENEKTACYKRVMLNLINATAGNEFYIKTDAPKRVELVTFRSNDKNTIRISAVDLSEEEDASDVPSFCISIRSVKPADRVELLPSYEQIPFEFKDGYVVFKTKLLNIFDMYQIDFS